MLNGSEGFKLKCQRIAVLFKVVPDPDGVYTVDAQGTVDSSKLTQVPSVFDENAVEAAVLIKEATQCRITVFCVGTEAAEPLVKRTLAMGADEAVLVKSGTGCDSLAAARLLTEALRASGPFDVILCGREAADTGSGLVGPYVAQALGMPFLTLASEIVPDGDALRVKRPCDGGVDMFRCHPPVLLTVTGEANRPRMPSVLKILQAKKIPVKTMAVDVAAAQPCWSGPAEAVIRARMAPSMSGKCTLIGGDSAAEKAAGLIAALQTMGAL